MYQSAPADLTVNIFEKTKVLIFIDYPLCAAFGPLLCLSGGQGRSKATPANIAVYVYKMFFHSVQKLLSGTDHFLTNAQKHLKSVNGHI